jgi:hypothetical protein
MRCFLVRLRTSEVIFRLKQHNGKRLCMRRFSITGPLSVVLILSVAACRWQSKRNEPIKNEVSDRATDPGTILIPTAEKSFVLLGDPARRRAFFQNALMTAGERCKLVQEAIFKGGLDGSDLWRVSCTDSGDWLVTVSNRPHPFVQKCTSALPECRDPAQRSQ